MAHNAAQSEEVVIAYDEENTLAFGVETSLVIFTNTGYPTLFVDKITVSGQTEAKVRILYKSGTVDKQRTSGSNINLQFDFPNGLLLKRGETIEVKVTNCEDGVVSDFNGTIYMHRTSTNG